MASNKNHIVGQIYNISSAITNQRVKLKEFDAQKVKTDEELETIEDEIKEIEVRTKGLTGKELYDIKKELDADKKQKEARKIQEKANQIDTIIEKTEDIIDNFEVKCLRYQEELEDAIEYERPLETEAKFEEQE